MTNGKAWREGYCDGLLGRNSNNPYKWDKAISMGSYVSGYSYGCEQRRIHGVTLSADTYRTPPYAYLASSYNPAL